MIVDKGLTTFHMKQKQQTTLKLSSTKYKQEAHEGLCSTGMVLWSFSIQSMYVWWRSDSKWRLFCVHKLYYTNFDNLMGHNPVLHWRIWLVCKRNRALINIELLSKFGEDQRVNGASSVFTSCIIAILTISRAIIQTCKGTSGWFSKGTKLSSIFNYYLSLVKIRY